MDDDGKHSRRDRLMGKLFKSSATSNNTRERKLTNEQSANDISSFLGGADRLTVTHPVPPPPPHSNAALPSQPPTLALDTSKISRYPQALQVDKAPGMDLPYRSRSHSPPRARPNKKGMVVRFSDNYPEVIGEGGDECEVMVAEIGKRKRSKSTPLSAPIPPTRQGHDYARQVGAAQEVLKKDDSFVPGPMRRTQTGYTSIPDTTTNDAGSRSLDVPSPEPPPPRAINAGDPGRTRFLDTNARKDENRRSFIEIQGHEHRQAEGRAFAASRSASADSQHKDWDDGSSSPEPVRETPPRQRLVPPPAINSDPPPSRAYSNRIPPSQPPAQNPMRSKSTRAPLPPGSLDGPMPSPSFMPPPRSPMRFAPKQEQPPPPMYASSPSKSIPMEADDPRTSTAGEDSPSSVYSTPGYGAESPPKATPTSQISLSRVPSSPTRARGNPYDSAGAAPDDPLEAFVARTKHLYELFRLYAEQLRPLETSRPDDMCRAALWWFIKGRTALENTIRSRPSNPEAIAYHR